MYGDIVSEDDIYFVLDNLCSASKRELKYIFGKDYKSKVFDEIIKSKDKVLIRLKNNAEAVGIVGIISVKENVGGLFFISTDNLKNGNMFTLLRDSKRYIANWNDKYKLLYDQCCKENTLVIKWLQFLKFVFMSDTEGFKLFYKGELDYDY